jgi:hypothetical protein
MDGEILSNVIKNTTLFDNVEDPPPALSLISLSECLDVMRRLMRGFNLNIKNNEACVFFKIYVQEGIKILEMIQNHFNELLANLRLNYMEKK